MATTRATDTQELEDMLHQAVGLLSPAHVAALLAHPDAVWSALAAVADALSASDREWRSSAETVEGDTSLLVGTVEARRRLSERTRMGGPETLLTSDELAVQAGFKTRQSVHDWRKRGRIVGWQNAMRGYVFPAAQLDTRNRPIPGLDRVVGQIGDGYAAWMWLTTPQSSLDGATPLTLLERGETDRVADAVRGELQGDFA